MADATASSSGGLPWDLLLEVGGNLLTGWMGDQGNKSATSAYTTANNAAIAEQRRQFDQMMQLLGPSIASENSRRSLADAFLGVPTSAYTGVGSGAYNLTQPYNPSDWGAGQPVAGHSGGGGSNPLLSAAGGFVGNLVGGPVGGFVGGALGSLVRNGGDNWTTYGTSAPSGLNYDAYFASDPGLAREWAKPDVQSLFGGNRDAYLWWHANGGVSNGKQQWAPNTQLLKDLSTPTSGSAGGSTTVQNPLTADSAQAIWKASPFYTAAKSGFDTDRNFLQGSAAAGGKLLSGSTLKALDDRAADRANQSAGQFYNALLGAPTNPSTSTAASSGLTFGNNLSNLLLNQGKVNAGAATNSNTNWMNTIKNIAGSVGDYGSSNGWF